MNKILSLYSTWCVLDGRLAEIYAALSTLAFVFLANSYCCRCATKLEGDNDGGCGLRVCGILPRFLRIISLHGKTRPNNGDDGNNGNDDKANKPVPYRPRARQLWDDTLCVPKRYFLFFYAFGLANHVAVVATTTTMPLLGKNLQQSPSVRAVLAVLIGIHLTRRTYECVRVHQWKRSASRMHLTAFLLGIFHYLLLPLALLDVSPVCFPQRAVADDSGGGVAELFSSSSTTRAPAMSICFGCFFVSAFCFWAQYQQYRHHVILANLRKSPKRQHANRNSSSTTSAYALPRGGWFEYVSCPHYLAEILIYASFAVLAEWAERQQDQQRSRSSRRFRHWFLFAWVASNLSVSALQSHAWYLQQFRDEYGRLRRTAIIPFLL